MERPIPCKRYKNDVIEENTKCYKFLNLNKNKRTVSTIGWEDKTAPRERRQWVRLSIRYFQMSCGMTLSQVQRGLKGALNRGYIIRRSRLGSYEYSIRWRESNPNLE